MTLNHHRYTFSDFYIHLYMVAVVNYVTAYLRATGRLNPDWSQHVYKLMDLQRELLPKTVKPSAQILEWRAKV